MTDREINLHPKNNPSVNLKPNIVHGNIPEKAVSFKQLDDNLQNRIEVDEANITMLNESAGIITPIAMPDLNNADNWKQKDFFDFSNGIIKPQIGGGRCFAVTNSADSKDTNIGDNPVFSGDLMVMGGNDYGGVAVGFATSLTNSYRGLQNSIALYVEYYNDNKTVITIYDNGSPVKAEGSSTTTTDYVLTGRCHFFITYFQGMYSFSLVGDNGVEIVRRYWSDKKPVGFYLFGSDGRSNPSYFYNVRSDYDLKRLQTGGKSILWNVGSSYANYRVYIPNGYDYSSKKLKAILFFHGHGSDETSLDSEGNYVQIQKALVNAGYIVISACDIRSRYTWGSKNSIQGYWDAMKNILSYMPIKYLSIFANSMGGIESLNFLRERKMKVSCWVATSPTYSLADNYSSFKSYIDQSYGISDMNPYDVATKGCDPALADNTSFHCIPMYAIVPSDDTIVSPGNNGDKLIVDVTPISYNVKKTSVTGGHAFNVKTYLSDIVNYFNANYAFTSLK